MPGTIPPPGHTPLVILPAVSLDLETTGLDVATDRIIQIGVVPLQGGQALDTPRLDKLINPGMAVPKLATRSGNAELGDASAFTHR